MQIADYIKHSGYTVIEGSSSPEQIAWFQKYLQLNPSIRRIAEIGFNEGVGSMAFLTVRDDISIVSFDIGWYPYSALAAKYIKEKYPGRHTMIWGDSRQTIQQYSQDHPEDKFDLIFIDGGHDYQVSRSDLLECHNLAHSKTVLIMDDLTPWVQWGYGPTKAWDEFVECGFINEINTIRDGEEITRQERKDGKDGKRIWAVGSYTN